MFTEDAVYTATQGFAQMPGKECAGPACAAWASSARLSFPQALGHPLGAGG